MEEIKIKHITKIEGHAKLKVKFDRKTKKVKVCSLDVFESPRYFESMIKGRSYKEVPYLAGRICGICNVAHLIGSTLAVEKALGIEVSEQTRALRELLVLGALFHSHVLHLYFLALPDYLGYSSALDMKGKDSNHVKRCLRIKEVGNEIVRSVGGRSIHPVTSVIGGFTRLPGHGELKKLKNKLLNVRKDAEKTVELFKTLNFPEVEVKELLALNQGSFLEGNVASLSGVVFEPEEYKKYLKEKIVSRSTAKHVTFKGKSFMVGPLARVNVRNMLNGVKKNVFYANLARAMEVTQCIDRCIEILDKLEIKNERIKKPKKLSGEGISITEAPRGLLIHHYKIRRGKVTYVNIIPPTTMNVKNMEDAIKQFIPKIINLSNERIRNEIEKLIRAYDPCFSCSAHFLELELVKK
ncbi:MAG TPA: Ni/Fe hydrogenase subunit alpha [Candidatus Aenigmarchaeota archaeon]|nr:Ni/Fe hydrogenase subunit alpha [Candidatus Aenigmarchaeota archaeon]